MVEAGCGAAAVPPLVPGRWLTTVYHKEIRQGFGLLAILAASASCAAEGERSDANAASTADGVPQYEVDPYWPKDLPNDWLIGEVGGVAVEKLWNQ